MPRASSGALVDSVNVATVWFSFCRAEALRDTAGERLAAVQTQRDHAFPAGSPRDGWRGGRSHKPMLDPKDRVCQRTNKERARAMPT